MDSSAITASFIKIQTAYRNLPPTLRDFQIEAITALTAGNDVILLTPTSSGKTLPFILAPLMMSSINPVTIVVVPLDSLMADMQKRINEIGFNAFVYKRSTFTSSKFAEGGS